ncbi:hypothetical protein [Parabacteroides distasonis]|uniref:Uncharacterized protein n=1 Tax=Parabacteroides distasonis TaxID=823 RepID=A0A174W1M7_PARDI|nr:hypothetical protein [Parabacteroides distasonis]MRY84987.1 hypothetical protein [Parabacteroides distasonis]MRZ06844.1 hypothetical protein [Parabacteroides distasonis]CUQ38427.1 Uncharacterised protein [Parabacteroides distasonis]
MNKTIKIAKEQNAFDMATSHLHRILSKNPNKHFKIGKTGQVPPEKRLENEDYKYIYRLFFVLYIDDDSDLISSLEKKLIQYCLNNYQVLCNNTNRGEIETTEESFNCVYVVIQ